MGFRIRSFESHPEPTGLSILIKGYWPQVLAGFLNKFVLFRWDIKCPESAVLVLSGAGGIGVVLDDSMNLFQVGMRVAMSLLAIFINRYLA